MSDDVVIRVEGLWKRYGLPVMPALRRFWNNLRNGHGRLHGLEGPCDDGPWALRDLSFEVRRGETLGIIGRNGAGKSTLLKVLAGVTPPTRGQVQVRGRIFPMIELNAGIHPELTGRENVYLLGNIMGLSQREIEAKMPEIEEFGELREWFDRPVRKYSSGMLARLGFGVAMNIDAHILLIDEVLAVGDIQFQRKCIDRIMDSITNGTTMILVSHNPYLVNRVCSSALLITAGRAGDVGNPTDVMVSYFQDIRSSTASQQPRNDIVPPADRPGTGQIRLMRLQILDPCGQQKHEVGTLEAITFRLYLSIRHPVDNPYLSIRIYDSSNTMIVLFHAPSETRHRMHIAGNAYLDCSIDSLPLMPGIYSVEVKIGGGDVLIDTVNHAASFTVTGHRDLFLTTGNAGLVYIPARWTLAEEQVEGCYNDQPCRTPPINEAS